MSTTKPRKPTIYDLAQLAGTSASTVSAVLNGSWQARRIGADTAERVRQLAKRHRYSVNRQARGLRKSSSGLIGMIIPTHEDRFFGTLSQVFDGMARARKLQPIVASTLRDPALEVATVKSLISHQVDHLIVTGATDPDAVARLCRHHHVKHVNVDLPGKGAPSVISDNRWGAAQLTTMLIQRSKPQPTRERARLYFIGGSAGEYATEQRMQGFIEVAGRLLEPVNRDAQILNCGYEVEAAERAMQGLYAKLGGLPRGILFASSLTLEGAVRFLKTRQAAELAQCVFASYDWDPFAQCLRFPVHMAGQDVPALLEAAFRIIDGGFAGKGRVVEIRPRVIPAD